MKNIKDKRQYSKIRRYGEKAHNIYTIYKSKVMPHGHHIYVKESDMDNGTICTYPQSDHALQHWKGVLRYCAECAHINPLEQ